MACRADWDLPSGGQPDTGCKSASGLPPRIAGDAGQFPSGARGSRPSYPLRLAPSLLFPAALSLPLSLPTWGALTTTVLLDPGTLYCTVAPCAFVPMYPRSLAARRPAIAEPRPRPSGIGKDPRPFTSNPRNPPFTFPHPTLLSLGPAASPPIVPVLECLPKSVWCFALWVSSDHRPPPSSKAPEIPPSSHLRYLSTPSVMQLLS